LGRVNTVVAESVGVGLLARGKERRRVGIGPSLVVPIINVFFKRNDFCFRERLASAQFLEKGIRRRAAGAALGGEELDDNNAAGSTGARLGGCTTGRPEDGE